MLPSFFAGLLRSVHAFIQRDILVYSLCLPLVFWTDTFACEFAFALNKYYRTDPGRQARKNKKEKTGSSQNFKLLLLEFVVRRLLFVLDYFIVLHQKYWINEKLS